MILFQFCSFHMCYLNFVRLRIYPLCSDYVRAKGRVHVQYQKTSALFPGMSCMLCDVSFRQNLKVPISFDIEDL